MNSGNEELKVIPTRRETGWVVQENIGIGIINAHAFWPWWKKMFYRLSFKSMKRRKLVKKLMKENHE
jgi:hypothetical protein